MWMAVTKVVDVERLVKVPAALSLRASRCMASSP